MNAYLAALPFPHDAVMALLVLAGFCAVAAFAAAFAGAWLGGRMAFRSVWPKDVQTGAGADTPQHADTPRARALRNRQAKGWTGE